MPPCETGVSSFSGYSQDGHTSWFGLVHSFGSEEFVAKIKNYGNPQGVADYTGGRSWKLSLAKGSKWEYLAGAPIAPLKVGKEQTINLLTALSAKYGDSQLRNAFGESGKRWKIEITGTDDNKGNDSKQLLFSSR